MRCMKCPGNDVDHKATDHEFTPPKTPCDHAGYRFELHGRVCPCGEWMVDFGD